MDGYYLMSTAKVALRAYRNPLRFAMYKPDNKTLVWEEKKGLTYGKETVHTFNGEKMNIFMAAECRMADFRTGIKPS